MNVLYVCTGNTCRSPMAQALTGVLKPSWTARSAGLAVHEGLPAAYEACRAMEGYGADLSSHLSQPLSRELMDWADRVYAVTDAHRIRICALYPDCADKVLAFGDVPDPYGGANTVYEACARTLAELIGTL